MGVLDPDIEEVNSRLLHLARDSELGATMLRLLGASSEVETLIRSSNDQGILTATRCGISLATVADIHEVVIRLRSGKGRTSTAFNDAPGKIQAFAAFTLQLAQRVAIQSEVLVYAHFGVEWNVADALKTLSLRDIESLSRSAPFPLQLRRGDRPVVWGHYLIGNRSTLAWAHRSSHRHALLSSGGQ